MAAKAVATISRLVRSRTEYMALMAPGLESEDLNDMYQKIAKALKQALWAIPYGVDVDIINPIVSQIMESPLPGDLKNDLAKCIHSKVESAPERATPLVVVDMLGSGRTAAAAEQPVSPPPGEMWLASAAMALIPDFEIHKCFRSQDWDYLVGPATLYQKFVYTTVFLRSLKLPKLREKVKARIVSLIMSIDWKMEKQPTVTEALNELSRFKIIMLKYEGADKNTCGLPRMPCVPSELQTICFETWSAMYNDAPPQPDRFKPAELVIAYSNDHCRSTKVDRSVEEAPEPMQPAGKRMADMDPLSTAMDPLARFEADRYNEACKTIKEEMAAKRTRDYVKLFDATLRLPQSERHMVHAELEAELPPVSERLTASELKAIIDRTARWVPRQARTPSPVPRYGRGEGGRIIRTPEDMRRIKAQRLNIQPNIQPNVQPTIVATSPRLHSIWPDSGSVVATVPVPTTIGRQTIKGLLWGSVGITKEERLEGLLTEMRSVGSEIFRLQEMISCHEGTNGGQALSAMIKRIDTAVARRMPDSLQFKIGITWNPPYRWVNPTYGYQDEGYIYMDILAWDYRGCMIGLMESALIMNFQKEQPRLCLNVKKGDDNRQSMPPQFLYVAYLP